MNEVEHLRFPFCPRNVDSLVPHWNQIASFVQHLAVFRILVVIVNTSDDAGDRTNLKFGLNLNLKLKVFQLKLPLHVFKVARFIVPVAVAQTAQLPALGQMSSWTGRAAS